MTRTRHPHQRVATVRQWTRASGNLLGGRLAFGTLKKFIEAMDGELVLAARFADGVEVDEYTQPQGSDAMLLSGDASLDVSPRT